MDKGFSRGHELYTINGIDWFYTLTNEPQYEIESCTKCGLQAKQDEPDPCLGMLPGVKYACCGHGIPGQDYILLNNGDRLSLEEYRQLENNQVKVVTSYKSHPISGSTNL